MIKLHQSSDLIVNHWTDKFIVSHIFHVVSSWTHFGNTSDASLFFSPSLFPVSAETTGGDGERDSLVQLL